MGFQRSLTPPAKFEHDFEISDPNLSSSGDRFRQTASDKQSQLEHKVKELLGASSTWVEHEAQSRTARNSSCNLSDQYTKNDLQGASATTADKLSYSPSAVISDPEESSSLFPEAGNPSKSPEKQNILTPVGAPCGLFLCTHRLATL
ncbi:unnamed protein product [Protopolystoma xenopodis]|uniref:Uncharacterized protein n=1 Tax=Protopolystoma xenopodis TaxID=117903 RepID=A0A3S5ADI8_9PLAT|nr:unnamed protein product [Protopolystoma xenopodis]